MELTFGMALVIASRERLCFVDLAERPDHELMFINVEIVLHNIHIRHTRITFFYVRFNSARGRGIPLTDSSAPTASPPDDIPALCRLP